MQQHRIPFECKARYFQLGDLNEQTKEIWFVFHGQGQLAEFFIRKFEPIKSSERCIIAPEALSHYYLNGYAGRVGASWMTREDRLIAIDNYLTFLNTLYNQLNITNIKIVVLGFSQGAATACRWVNQSLIKFDHLIVWGGIFPPDLKVQEMIEQLKNKQITIAYGDKDPFILDVHKREQQARIDLLKITPVIEVFDGEHEIHSETLIKISQN